MDLSRPLFLHFCLFCNLQLIDTFLLMLGFQPQISGFGCDRSANCATTTAKVGFILLSQCSGFKSQHSRNFQMIFRAQCSEKPFRLWTRQSDRPNNLGQVLPIIVVWLILVVILQKEREKEITIYLAKRFWTKKCQIHFISFLWTFFIEFSLKPLSNESSSSVHWCSSSLFCPSEKLWKDSFVESKAVFFKLSFPHNLEWQVLG